MSKGFIFGEILSCWWNSLCDTRTAKTCPLFDIDLGLKVDLAGSHKEFVVDVETNGGNASAHRAFVVSPLLPFSFPTYHLQDLVFNINIYPLFI